MLEQNKKQQPSKNEAIDGNIVLAVVRLNLQGLKFKNKQNGT